MGDPFPAWFTALEARHRSDLTFAEIRRALQALSSLYVERREKLGASVFEGKGKRAAFALYYGPIHFLLVREVVRALGAADPPPARVVDLGCGTGVAGAAWALEAGGRPRIEGLDQSGWALDEARRGLAGLGLRATLRRGDVASPPALGRGDAVVAAFTVNELPPEARPPLLARLEAGARAGASVLVVEPLARRALSWWGSWAAAFAALGGRADEWRFPAELPETLHLLDRAAGLDHRELTGRSLWIAAPAARVPGAAGQGQAGQGVGSTEARQNGAPRWPALARTKPPNR